MKHTKMNYKQSFIILVVIFLIGLSGCNNSKQFENKSQVLGTVVSATAYGSNAQNAVDSALSVFKAIDAMVDPNNISGATFELNNADGESIVVPGQIVEMIDEAKSISEKTNGSIDLTIWPIIQLWGFDTGSFCKPTDSAIDSAREKLCSDKIITECFNNNGDYTVTLPNGAGITFSCLARGCASDYAIQAMRNQGAESGIVSMYGCIQTLGVKPNGTYWNVAVPHPDNSNEYLGYLSVGEIAISSTSANTLQFTYSDGITYHHIIDPSTGYPAKTDLKSVTIFSNSGLHADALSTALFINGKNGALDYWRTYGNFEMILVTDSNQVLCTSGLTEAFVLEDTNYKLCYIE